jgi:hypothetical protein
MGSIDKGRCRRSRAGRTDRTKRDELVSQDRAAAPG